MKNQERDGRYGINMKQWCRRHEAAVLAFITQMHAAGADPVQKAGADAYPVQKAGAGADPVQKAGADADPAQSILNEHIEKIRWLQHERLVHLIVTVMVVFVELFTVFFAVLHPELGLTAPVIMLLLAVLLGFYFYHYFFLENTVQRWYRIAEELENLIDSDKE